MSDSRARFLVLVSALLLITGLVMALVLSRGEPEAVFTLRDGEVYREQEALRLRNRLDIHLPDEVLEALNSGVPLVFQVDLHLFEKRHWLLGQQAADFSRRYRLHFHTLSRSYLLTRLDTGERSIHHILGGALARMSNHRGTVLAPAASLHPDRNYEARMRIRLDEADLPAPLQAPILFSDAWNLDSGWYRWALLR